MKYLKVILKEYNLNKSTNKYGTDKGDYKSYVDLFYEKYFLKYKNKKINLLEIGFRNGASLFLWSKYFKKGKIIGLDNGSDLLIKEKSYINKWIKQPNIKIKICDAYSKKVSKSIRQNFDIIIDDGPHTLNSQIKSISYYFPKLKKNGYLIIEDILKGYISCFFLSIRTPINCKIKVHNFRKHKPGRDNMLFVIQKKSFKYQMILIRLLLIIRLFFNIPKELFYKAKI